MLTRILRSVVIEWRHVFPTHADIHGFVRAIYKGNYTLGRFVQDDFKGSVQVIDLDIPPRQLANVLNDEFLHGRPVFSYPSFRYS